MSPAIVRVFGGFIPSLKVGPIDNGDHVGGNYAAALGFNVSLPNILPEELKTAFSALHTSVAESPQVSPLPSTKSE